MSDLYTQIASLDDTELANIAEILESRARDAQQREILDAYIAHINFPARASILEIGCGTGPVIRRLARVPQVAEATGVDPSPYLLDIATKLSVFQQVNYVKGDALQLPFDDKQFDIAVFHTTLSHISNIDKALTEARRVLKDTGQLVIFDADYSSLSFSSSDNDPLHSIARAATSVIAHNPHLIQQLRGYLTNTHFSITQLLTFCYHGITAPEYMLSVFDRGTDALYRTGALGRELANGYKNEVRRRIKNGTFHGHINYACFIADVQASVRPLEYLGGIPLEHFDPSI